MKKKIVTGMLVALALCSITACGKNKASSSASQSASAVGAEASGTAEGSALAAASTTSQTAETAGSQTAETSSSQTPETASAISQTPEVTADQTTAAASQSTETVSAAITLDEDMASVSYVLLARMISEYEGNTAFNAEDKTNGDTFWKEMNYLVSAYGVNNKRISFDETSKQYTVKKAQLRFYAAALYSDLGKAKKLPQIADGSESVTKSGSKWQFAMNDTSAYDVAVQSCEKLDKSGTYRITAYLVDASTRTSLGEYSAEIRKSPYKGKKSPFHYTIVSLEKMTKMLMETVLVGNTDSNTDTQDTAEQTAGTTTGTTATQTASTGQTTTGSTDSSSSSYGTVLSMPGTSTGSSDTTGTAAGTTDTTGTQTAGTTDSTGTQTVGTTDSTAGQTTGTDSDTITGASVTADAAKEIAQNYYGASSADGKEYTYKYEGTTTYQNVPYYNFSVSDGSSTVINILVSGDGARIYKGTNTNGSWTMQ